MTYAGTTQDNWTRDGASRLVNAGSLGIVASTPYAGGATSSYTRDAQGTLVSQSTPQGTYHYLYDGQGSVVALTDSTGHVAQTYSYDPYGNTTTALGTVTNPWRYTGGYKDDQTGLYKYGARHYNPALGQWTQRDPSGRDSNPYTYAGGNPTSKADPSGLDECGKDWTLGGLVDCASKAPDFLAAANPYIVFVAALIGAIGAVATCAVATAGICAVVAIAAAIGLISAEWGLFESSGTTHPDQQP